MIKKIIAFGLFLLVANGVCAGSVVFYGTYLELSIYGGSAVGLPDEDARVIFLFGYDVSVDHRGLFPDLILTSSDAGNTYIADRTNSPHFDYFVQSITNGIDDWISFGFYWPDNIGLVNASWSSISESSFFNGATPNGIDLEGCSVESVIITVDLLEFDIPGTNPNGDGEWVDYGVELTIKFIPGLEEPIVPPTPIEEILLSFAMLVDDGGLAGNGPGNSADGRLNALVNMIEEAQILIDSGLYQEACQQLKDAYNRCDGQPKPPDFVTGIATELLAYMIVDVIDSLGCDSY